LAKIVCYFKYSSLSFDEHCVQALEKNEPFETDGFDNLQILKLVDDAYRLAGLPAEHKGET
jgi:hypothetical protein